MKNYDPKKIEKKWQKYWEKNRTFLVKEDPKKKKFYALIEFPYPSAAGLHVGHPRSYTAMDVIARKRRMEGYNVLYPIGFDSFGLPTENYAIKTGRPPAEVTVENVATFTKQLKSFGFSFDWSRAFATTDPKYYKWTQWIFLQFFKHGLAYKKNMPINWCLNCQIGLANEEVVDGQCERCGGPVEKRDKEQWMLAITKYADKLLEGLKDVDYILPAKIQQENWIGRSEGTVIKFEIRISPPKADPPRAGKSEGNSNIEIRNVTVFTTRLDTLFGATYMVVAPEHELIINHKSEIVNLAEVEKYIVKASRKTDIERTAIEKEKTGVELKGLKAVNPITDELIPIWVADYVLATYGTGAIMAVPAHDERDFAFAKKYGLPIKVVVRPTGGSVTPGSSMEEVRQEVLSKIMNEEAFSGDGYNINSDFLNGLRTIEAKEKIIQWLEEKGLGRRQVQYKLRDWVFSRQRYWGEPIPLVYCERCAERNKEQELAPMDSRGTKNKGETLNPGWIPLPEDQLPLKLPPVKKYQPTNTGESPLAAMIKWVHTKCPRCGGKAKRETDTMPNWAGSSWYFLRYCDSKNNKEFASMEKLNYWLAPVGDKPLVLGGVDWYNGGMEHTVLHLLYSRFWNQFLYDIGVVPTREPYAKRTSHGMILGADGEKMSKSRGNVVNPDEMVAKFGADTLRAYILFMGPFAQAVVWDTNGLIGVRRFLERVWSLQKKVEVNHNPKSAIDSLLQRTIKKVSNDIEAMRFNTAIAKLMELVNEMVKAKSMSPIAYRVLLKLLSPFAPHLAEELWSIYGEGKGSIAHEPWPKYDSELAKEEEITIAIQVNGKLRDTMAMPIDLEEAEVKQRALGSEKVQKWLDGKEPKKVIYVAGRLVSVVV